jgi:hypothetical protein
LDNQKRRQQPLFEGPYRLYCDPEIQRYNYLMTKLEVLSGVVLNYQPSLREDWGNALGPYQRHLFAELCNRNNTVRCFAKELPDDHLSPPQRIDYAQNIPKKSHGQPPNSSIRHLSAPLALLSKVRTVVLLDDSDSMTLPDHLPLHGDDVSSETRWDKARRIIASVAPKVTQYSRHGIDLHFLNRDTFYSGLHTDTDVYKAFNDMTPANGTPTGIRVNDILDAYMCTLRYYQDLIPLNLLIITDGEANDKETLQWTFHEHLTNLTNHHYPAHQLGIEFMQVGDCMKATRQIVKLLKKVNRHCKRDIVGVTTTTRMSNINPDLLLASAASGIDARINSYIRTPRINLTDKYIP